MLLPTNNLNIESIQRLLSPRELKEVHPTTPAANQLVYESRETIKRILAQEDKRFLVVVGPCSVHDPVAVFDYATRLKTLQDATAGEFFILMRVYFEKPRTTIGWKGLINDPHLDGSCDVETGLKRARELLLRITGLGVACATEFLDPIVPQYIGDLVSWAAIGARTTESQTHRELASGLSMPIGFKNGTDGSLQTALDAMVASRSAHSFLGIDQEGLTSLVKARGNPWGHVVLRGGRGQTNYDAENLRQTAEKLAAAKLPPAIMVDCSHANSGKRYERQEVVWQSLIEQKVAGNDAMIGAMLESFIGAGNQAYPQAREKLQYGVSITDPCIDWGTTERLLLSGSKSLAAGKARKQDREATAQRAPAGTPA
jgi:3-deoxy-7-phosphoheptulonate synthase